MKKSYKILLIEDEPDLVDLFGSSLKDAGFQVVKVVKGPVASGYGFGFDGLRSFLEKLGFCSEYMFVTVCKKNGTSD